MTAKVTSRCMHNRRTYYCVDCNGKGVCIHLRRRSQCKLCGGSMVCQHSRQKNSCMDCNGSSRCSHGKFRLVCIKCRGASVCQHLKQKTHCRICSPKACIVHNLRNALRRCISQSSIKKSKSIMQYVGCSVDAFIEHIQKKMDYFNRFLATDTVMTFSNIHYDHIRPLKVFDLNNKDEFDACNHVTNIQPLLIQDNMNKHDKWDAVDERFWIENIRNNVHFSQIYFPRAMGKPSVCG